MTRLNLTANGTAQELILAYLQKNASDVLAEKINNGVSVTKDGKRLVSKKDLNGFMAFASDEARKTASKGERSACVEDAVVYGWAIHYFEEDSIEGKLYNEDGTEYKPVVKSAPKAAAKPVPQEPPKPKQHQGSLFDMLADAHDVVHGTDKPNPYRVAKELKEKVLEAPSEEAEDEGDGEEVNDDYTPAEIEEEIAEIMEQEKQIPIPPPAKQPNTIYQRYLNIQKQYPDCVIVLRLGDFYEIFGQNAVLIAKDLDITLTGRDNGQGERVPMIGIPHHASENYFAKMNGRGYKLAIVENGNTDGVTLREPVLRVDTETGEILSDGAAQTSDIPTVTKIVSELGEDKTNLGAKAEDIQRAGEILQQFEDTPDDEDEEYPSIDTKAFDPEALAVLDGLFGNTMILR
ncbi:MAG: Cas9 inhibitor AcrIIA9 family protein [Lachnospiraceae bacterium]|nr:Cas9 inhibitor AcrIIA9 family protein [Lachnospiraceae bacterium]